MGRRSVLSMVVLFLGAALHVHASEPAGGINSNIANAHWDDYRDMYPDSILCEPDEITLWTCEGSRRTYSLCSSVDITDSVGYLQYRAGDESGTAFRFPRDKRHPRTLFTLRASPSGDVSVMFQNEGYHYTLIDRLRDASSLWLAKEPEGIGVAEIACRNWNQSLQLNYTLKLMKQSGVSP